MGAAITILKPDLHGQVYISTSLIFRAMITAEFIGCEADFAYAPSVDGYPPTGVKIEADGTVTWILGNLGLLPVIRLSQGAYSTLGWNISVTDDGGLQILHLAAGRAFNLHPEGLEAL